MKNHTKMASVFFALTFMTSFFGFQKSSEAETMRIAWQSADVNIVLMAAHKGGIFKKVGLDYSLTSFPSGGKILPAMAASKVDIGWMGEFAALTGFSNGIPLEVFLVSHDWPSYLRVIVQPDSGIKKITDLRGKKIGMAFGSSGHNHTLAMLEQANLTASDVSLINIQPSQLPAAMLTKQIDVAVIWETNAGLIERNGGVPIASSKSLDQWLLGIWIARKEYARKNPENMQKFIRGWSLALQQLNKECQKTLGFESARIKQPPEQLTGLLKRAGTKWPSFGELLSNDYMGKPGEVEKGRLYKHYEGLANFLISLDRLKAVPTNLVEVINNKPVAKYLAAYPGDASNGPVCPK